MWRRAPCRPGTPCRGPRSAPTPRGPSVMPKPGEAEPRDAGRLPVRCRTPPPCICGDLLVERHLRQQLIDAPFHRRRVAAEAGVGKFGWPAATSLAASAASSRHWLSTEASDGLSQGAPKRAPLSAAGGSRPDARAGAGAPRRDLRCKVASSRHCSPGKSVAGGFELQRCSTRRRAKANVRSRAAAVRAACGCGDSVPVAACAAPINACAAAPWAPARHPLSALAVRASAQSPPSRSASASASLH